MSQQNRESLTFWLAIIAAGFILYSFQALYRMFGPSPSPNLELIIANSQPVELYGTPGKSVEFRAYVGDSIKGHWAAPDGLVLRLAPSDSNSPINIGGVEAKPEDWGSSITVKPGEEQGRKFYVKGLFLLPSSAEIGGTLQATLTGELTYPHASFGGFTEITEDLNIPVKIHVVSLSDLREETVRREIPAFLKAFGVGLLLALIAFLLHRSR